MSTATQAGESDALLDELNGAMPPMAPGDAEPVPAPSREAELTVPSPPPPTAVRAADALHATSSGGKGWVVKVVGEYLAMAADGQKKVKRDYEAEFRLPHLDAALSVIKNKLLEPTLRKKYADFVGVRTHKIASATPMSPETPASNNLQYMSREQLSSHILAIRAPIDASAYPEVTDLRDAVIDFTQTPKGFPEREAKRQKDRAEDRELRALNPDVPVGSAA